MRDFKKFKEAMQQHVDQMIKGHNHLFMADVDKDEMWEHYLNSFPAGTNVMFRERTEHDCSCCKQFIRAFGNVVVINDDYSVATIWDFAIDDSIYQQVADEMAKKIRQAAIRDVFVSDEIAFGTEKNYEDLGNGKFRTWHHFRIKLPDKFKTRNKEMVNTLRGEYREQKNVLKRSLEEISDEAVNTVLELISQNSLYKGEEWKGLLSSFANLKKDYKRQRSKVKKDRYCWKMSTQYGGALSKIRNHSIGVLLTDITNGVELDDAVTRYERIVAPSNYKRPKAIFTKKMVEDAKKKVQELGLENSLDRRHATIEDITVNNILYANRDAAKRMSGDVFDDLQEEVAVNPKRFSKVEEVSITHFVSEILPHASEVQLLFENRHTPNLVSLIAPQDPDSKLLFKWKNNFSWAYNGNITDSMKEQVKDAGGNVEGVLRFSLQWNDEGENDNDFDAHCIEPSGREIMFKNKGSKHPSSGMLDVDITDPNAQRPDKPAVENITWTDLNKMPEGTYHFFVNNFAHNGGRTGFSAEIEFNGEIYHFEYSKELKNKEKVTVAKIKFSKENGIEFIESLDSTTSTKEVWNLQTNQFYPVSVLMYSPNYWDGQEGIGHRHYFFMVDGCKNEDRPNGFFNEFLSEDLMKHKRVFEALGSRMRVEPSENQLSGLGFSSTKRNSLICKVKGNIDRTIKLTF